MNGPVQLVPVLPDNAPFTAEQRAYLNGFLAGLFSHALVPAASGGSSPAAQTLEPLTILFGSQTGNAETLWTLSPDEIPITAAADVVPQVIILPSAA